MCRDGALALQLCTNIVHHSPSYSFLSRISGDAPPVLSRDGGVLDSSRARLISTSEAALARASEREPSLLP